MLHPLYTLLRTDRPWHWSTECQDVFEKAKQCLTRAPVLAHYDPKLTIVLVADASAYGVGAVISHQPSDGTERPIVYASRTLNGSEQNNSQIDKEALSLVFGLKMFHNYLYGH